MSSRQDAGLLSSRTDRRSFIGGSNARIIMGQDEAALLRLWREKRGEAEPEDLSRNLLVQLGRATEDLNRRYDPISLLCESCLAVRRHSRFRDWWSQPHI